MALEKQLILKGVITSDDWDVFKNKIHVQFNSDNFFAELKDAEILRERLSTLSQIDPFLGRFYSNHWVMKNVLMMTEEDIEQNKAEIDEEKAADPDAFPTLNAMQAPPPPIGADGEIDMSQGGDGYQPYQAQKDSDQGAPKPDPAAATK